MHDFKKDARFQGLKALEKQAFLATPTMHGEELKYIKEAYDSGWMTTVGENIDEIEKLVSEYIGVNHAVALTCGTAALHLAIKLAAEKLYHSSTGISTPDGRGYGGSLFGKKVFCSDLTFSATVNPVVYEGGEPVFIDSEYDTWNMDPQVLEQAFAKYSDVRLVVLVHLYGTPAKVKEIKKICARHGALLIEDAAESLGAQVSGCQTGSFGDYGVISFNGNKIITGSSGGMLLLDDAYGATKARKWSTQSREVAPWYEHEELGYNYRISNVVAGVVRGQWEHLCEHIEAKREIYERYKEGLKGLPVEMNPVQNAIPNFWLSCMLIKKEALADTACSGKPAVYSKEKGKTSPSEILEALAAFHAEGRPIWKPMHMQPIYASNEFVTKRDFRIEQSDDCIKHEEVDVSGDIFNRGVCLPSDNKMTSKMQDRIIEIIHRCFE